MTDKSLEIAHKSGMPVEVTSSLEFPSLCNLAQKHKLSYVALAR